MDIDLQKGLLGLLGVIIAGLLGWRGFNKVGNDNARANRESRFDENVQKRLDAAIARAEELQEQLSIARDGRALLERQLDERNRRVKNLLELLAPQDRKMVERWVEESGFAPFEEARQPPRRR